MYVEEASLDFSYFHCCGDEDLYPFGCPSCQHIMVFCYECDTLYPELTNLTNHGREAVNSFDTKKPIFACPHCNYKFEYFFMKNSAYRILKADWIAAGFGHLLQEQ